MTLTLNSFGVTTFYYSDSAYICPQGITGYIVTEIPDEITVTEKQAITAGDIIPKGNPLIIKGTPSTTYEFVPIDSDLPPIENNLLKGSNEKQFMPSLKNYDIEYRIFVVINGKPAWNWSQQSGYNSAHKCYLVYNPREKHSDQKSAGLIEGFSYVPIK